MKRKVAIRKLQRTCNLCYCSFNKGEVYYVDRKIIDEDGEIFTFENTRCARCKYNMEKRAERFARFKIICAHPRKETVWSYIPGEAVMQPDHDECLLCGTWV